MDTVLRASGIYLFLLIVFRFAGKRSVSHMTAFDFVLLLIVAESSQQGLTANDYSVVNAVILVTTLVSLDIGLSLLKQRFPRLDSLIESEPVVILENGRPLEWRMRKARVDEGDIMHAARELQGLERLDQIKYAVLEPSGGITVIPK